MVISADTSFLFSLYGNDCNTPAAVEWSKKNSLRITISPLNHFELLNALRFAEFRKTIKLGDADRFAAHFKTDLDGQLLTEARISLDDILAEANRLSRAHTLKDGHRGFDILHVAAARIMKATHFLTFDANQKRLAENEGLSLPL